MGFIDAIVFAALTATGYFLAFAVYYVIAAVVPVRTAARRARKREAIWAAHLTEVKAEREAWDAETAVMSSPWDSAIHIAKVTAPYRQGCLTVQRISSRAYGFYRLFVFIITKGT